jgi:hypothetical protein
MEKKYTPQQVYSTIYFNHIFQPYGFQSGVHTPSLFIDSSSWSMFTEYPLFWTIPCIQITICKYLIIYKNWLSMGSSVRQDISVDIIEVFIQTEAEMYRYKLSGFENEKQNAGHHHEYAIRKMQSRDGAFKKGP